MAAEDEASEKRNEGDGGAAEAAPETEKRVIVVGVKMDAASRALLTWSLVNAAAAGDRVVAVHVVHSGDAAALDFDGMLAVYDGFCRLKQIEMQVKICRAASARKGLAREAGGLAAAAVVVGVAQQKKPLSSGAGVAKYCARKLPASTAVVAVSNGKVVFQSDAAGRIKSRKVSAELSGDSDLYCVLPTKKNVAPPLPALEPERAVAAVADADMEPLHDAEDDVVEDRSNAEVFVDAVSDDPPKPSTSIADIADAECGSELAAAANGEASDLPADQDGVLYCLLPKRDQSGRSSCSSRRVGSSSGSSSFFSDTAEDEPAALRDSPAASTSSSLLSFKKLLLEGRADRCSLRPRRTSTFDWARLPMVHWSLRHRHRKPLSTDAELAESPWPAFPWETWPPPELVSLQEKYSSICRIFAYDEIRAATSEFSSENLIGKGGSSHVYKGTSPDGVVFAAKILRPTAYTIQEFVSEVEIVSCLQHKNIISLHGFCVENSSLILVYDYLPCGSLEEALHGDREQMLGWSVRFSIAVAVGEAIDFLHSGCATQFVIHGDVKSSNILLSEDFRAKLCDFGLAKWVSSSAPHVTCADIAGTFGYLPPEYFLYGRVNEKVDVYAYGVVLLELISGRKAILAEGGAKSDESLVSWAKPIISSGERKGLIDAALADDYDCDEMERMTLAALLCTRTSYRSRPKMSMVVKLLKGDTEAVEWARSEVAVSEDSEEEAMLHEPHHRSLLDLALMEVDDGEEESGTDRRPSVSSTDVTTPDTMSRNTSFDGGAAKQWSRSSSFD